MSAPAASMLLCMACSVAAAELAPGAGKLPHMRAEAECCWASNGAQQAGLAEQKPCRGCGLRWAVGCWLQASQLRQDAKAGGTWQGCHGRCAPVHQVGPGCRQAGSHAHGSGHACQNLSPAMHNAMQVALTESVGRGEPYVGGGAFGSSAHLSRSTAGGRGVLQAVVEVHRAPGLPAGGCGGVVPRPQYAGQARRRPWWDLRHHGQVGFGTDEGNNWQREVHGRC